MRCVGTELVTISTWEATQTGLLCQVQERDRLGAESQCKDARNSVSRILSGNRDADADAYIAIAYGLGVSRNEVVRARGWLLTEPEMLIQRRMLTHVS